MPTAPPPAVPLMSDPRVFFAAERTLLAWIRTGLTIMGLGFVVARFGLFLALLAAGPLVKASRSTHWTSSVMGIALVLIGAGSIVVSALNYRKFLITLPETDRPPAAMGFLGLSVAMSMAMAGAVLAVYLAFS